MEKTRKRCKIFTWLLIVSIAVLVFEVLFYESEFRWPDGEKFLFPIPESSYTMNLNMTLFKLGYLAAMAVPILMFIQMLIGFVSVLRKRKGGLLCYLLVYVELLLMIFTQHTWAGGPWLRYIMILAVLLISGFQGEYARKLCKESKS